MASRQHFAIAQPPRHKSLKSPTWAIVPCHLGANQRAVLVKTGAWPMEAEELIVGTSFSAVLEQCSYNGQTQYEAKDVRAERGDHMVLLQTLVRNMPKVKTQLNKLGKLHGAQLVPLLEQLAASPNPGSFELKGIGQESKKTIAQLMKSLEGTVALQKRYSFIAPELLRHLSAEACAQAEERPYSLMSLAKRPGVSPLTVLLAADAAALRKADYSPYQSDRLWAHFEAALRGAAHATGGTWFVLDDLLEEMCGTLARGVPGNHLSQQGVREHMQTLFESGETPAGLAHLKAADVEGEPLQHLYAYAEAAEEEDALADAFYSLNEQSGLTGGANLLVGGERFGLSGHHCRRLYEQLDATQRSGVVMALQQPISVLNGGAGTGKSKCIGCIVQAVVDTGRNVAVLAPTAMAAERAGEGLPIAPSTIHSALARRTLPPHGVVIVDESSLLSSDLALRLLREARERQVQAIVFCGDPNQLGSIDRGRVLSDLVRSGVVPVRTLTHIYRTAGAGATIPVNAQAALRGGPLAPDDHSFMVTIAPSENAAYAQAAQAADQMLRAPHLRLNPRHLPDAPRGGRAQRAAAGLPQPAGRR